MKRKKKYWREEKMRKKGKKEKINLGKIWKRKK
jgi:hypothetical protein